MRIEGRVSRLQEVRSNDSVQKPCLPCRCFSQSSLRRGCPFFFFWWTFFKSWAIPCLENLLVLIKGRSNNPYVKIKDKKSGDVKFFLCKDGRTTDKGATFSLNQAHFKGFSYFDHDLKIRLIEILRKEGIDRVRATTIPDGKKLWDCGLKTTDEIEFNFKSKTPSDKRFVEMLRVGFCKPISIQLIRQIQKELLLGWLTDAQGLVYGYDDPDQHRVDGSLIKGKIQTCERLLSTTFDLPFLIRNEVDPQVKSLFDQVNEAHFPPVPGEVTETTLSYSSLFALMEQTGMNFDKIFIPKLPQIIFTT